MYITSTVSCRLNHQPVWHFPTAELNQIHQIPDEGVKLSYRLKWFPVCDSSDFQYLGLRQEVWLPWIAADQLKDAELQEEKPSSGLLDVSLNRLFLGGQSDTGSDRSARINGGHQPCVQTTGITASLLFQESSYILLLSYWSTKIVRYF